MLRYTVAARNVTELIATSSPLRSTVCFFHASGTFHCPEYNKSILYIQLFFFELLFVGLCLFHDFFLIFLNLLLELCTFSNIFSLFEDDRLFLTLLSLLFHDLKNFIQLEFFLREIDVDNFTRLDIFRTVIFAVYWILFLNYISYMKLKLSLKAFPSSEFVFDFWQSFYF